MDEQQEEDVDYELDDESEEALQRLLDREGIMDAGEREMIRKMMLQELADRPMEEGEEDAAGEVESEELRQEEEGVESEELLQEEEADAKALELDQELDPTMNDHALEAARAILDPADVAQAARQRFGDRLPEGALRPDEYTAYERMYGQPLRWTEESEMSDAEIAAMQAEEDEVDMPGGLEKMGQGGEWSDVDGQEAEEEVKEVGRGWRAEKDDVKLREEIQRAMEQGFASEEVDATEAVREEAEVDDAEPEDGLRTHPFTLAGRSGTTPSTVTIPRDSLAGPTSVMLSDISNKHLDQTAEKLFGGKGLPYATGSPVSSRSMPQKPIPLTAGQGRMTSTEADVWMAALAPGIYATAMSILVEIRKRMGTAWIESLLLKEGGPRVLDAGGAGAGILAWREIVEAEWSRMHGDAEPVFIPPAPLGKSTVLTGSDALRLRASALLENTTFLPRLPDYIHVQDKNSTQRKQFDLIIAPHTLWDIAEEHLRRQHVENLWSLLSPHGGILVLVEKGVPRGFEVVASARQHLLSSLFAPTTFVADDPRRQHAGAIIAPCTTDAKCPMYPVPGISRQRKDYCHFTQRYLRPPYLQRLLGAKARNHEDVRFSYLAVHKGPLLAPPLTGDAATARAFTGYDLHDPSPTPSASLLHPAIHAATPDAASLVPPAPQAAPPHPRSLPRLVLPPLKRHGHVILDVCTPAGRLERWTVARSFGRQAYRDARKAAWGDLWALGAKIRIPRSVRLGRGREGAAATAGVGGMEEGGINEVDGVEEKEARKEEARVGRRREERARGREKARMRKRSERKGEGGLVGF